MCSLKYLEKVPPRDELTLYPGWAHFNAEMPGSLNLLAGHKDKYLCTFSPCLFGSFLISHTWKFLCTFFTTLGQFSLYFLPLSFGLSLIFLVGTILSVLSHAFFWFIAVLSCWDHSLCTFSPFILVCRLFLLLGPFSLCFLKLQAFCWFIADLSCWYYSLCNF
jgi:hypothetical protein